MIISTLGEGCEDKWADRCKVADGKCSLKSGVGCWDCYHHRRHHHRQRLEWRGSRFHTCHEFKIKWPNRRELKISFGFLDRVGDRVRSAGQQDCWSENAIKIIKGWDQHSGPSQLQEQTPPNLLMSWSSPSHRELVFSLSGPSAQEDRSSLFIIEFQLCLPQCLPYKYSTDGWINECTSWVPTYINKPKRHGWGPSRTERWITQSRRTWSMWHQDSRRHTVF